MSDTNITHAFEEAGLGRAPFRFLGCRDTSAGADANGMVRSSVGGSGVETWTKPGGSCEFCGTYIVIFCMIQDADGKRFHVGTSCAGKSGDKGIINLAKRAAGKLSRAKALVKQAARIVAARAAFSAEGSEVRAALAAKPHPGRAAETLADYVEWMLVSGHEFAETIRTEDKDENGYPIWTSGPVTYRPGAGHAGQFKMAKLIEKTIKEAK